MRIIVNVKEIGGKIGIEAKLDTGCRDTAEKPGRWARVKAFFGGKRAK